MLSALYAAAARRRRERYARRPDLRRRLPCPVISVGNLAVGGRGKTPLVAAIARLLLDGGERPAILSRGYARTDPQDGVVVVRDPEGVRADLGRAGDEPLMLARQLPGACVLVCPDRYLAGRLAEHHFGATVHLLDDGFQHLQLERDIDLLIVGRDDVERPFTLPRGRLREPLDTIVAADAVLTQDDEVQVEVLAGGADIPVYRLRRSAVPAPPAGPVLAVAGTANPARFFDDLRGAGWTLSGAVAFPDHHAFTARDVGRLVRDAKEQGAGTIVTTGKDLVRLLPFRPFPMPCVAVPMSVAPEPFDEFAAWLTRELQTVRGA